MTILDELVYKEEPQFDPVTTEYTGTLYTTRITIDDGFLITKEAEIRDLAPQSIALGMRRSRQKIKTLLLKSAIEILQAEHIKDSGPLKGLDYPIYIVIIHEAEKVMLVAPPSEFLPLLKAFEMLEEDAKKKAFEELAFGATS